MRPMRLAALFISAMLAFAACGGDAGSGGATTAAGGGDTNEVVMQAISFQPNEITVQAGTTVTWTNQDSVPHTTTSDDDVWDSGTLSAGSGEFSFTFDEPGTFTYFCTIHPNQMQATVIVEG